MNKIVKNIIIFTVISVSAIIVKSDSKIETEKEIIYNYYDIDDDISSIKVDSILEKIDKEYDIDRFSLDTKEDVESVLLLNAVIDNNKLSEEERELCYSMVPFYLDYDNLNRKSIYERLSNLDIIYSNKEIKVNATDTKGATYYPDKNIIICRDKRNIVLKHELFHVSMPMTNFPKALREGLVSKLTKEYFYYNSDVSLPSTYREYMALINSLTYIVDSDTLIEVASFNDLEKFKEVLLSKGSIMEDELNNIFSFLDKELNIMDKTNIVRELVNSYPVLKEEPKALGYLEVYNLYDSSISDEYYFNKAKIKK